MDDTDLIKTYQKLYPNFEPEEFACPCCNRTVMEWAFLSDMQKLRDTVGMPLVISSGFRCSYRNNDVSGAPHSQHMEGRAADVQYSHMTSSQKFALVRAAMSIFRGVWVYSSHLHVDGRPSSMLPSFGWAK
jgi:uncharacterized protein YcbK (DUF882 family)